MKALPEVAEEHAIVHETTNDLVNVEIVVANPVSVGDAAIVSNVVVQAGAQVEEGNLLRWGLREIIELVRGLLWLLYLLGRG